MELIIHLILSLVLLITCSEALSWSVSMYKHIGWLKKHTDYSMGLAVTPSMLYKGIVLTTLFLLILWIVFTDMLSTAFLRGTVDYASLRYIYFLTLCATLTHIHVWSMFARFTCLHVVFWPFLSIRVYKLLQRYTKHGDIGDYCLMFKEWQELSEMAKQHRSLIVNFLDIIPDLVWTKDMDDRFTYVNSSICEKLLLCDKAHALGNTSVGLAKEAVDRDVLYTFGAVCEDSDQIVKKVCVPKLFMEHGVVDGKFLALQVLKAPIWDTSGEFPILIGTIGVGRDVTKTWNEYSDMEKLIDAKQCDLALETLRMHIQKFKNFHGDVK